MLRKMGRKTELEIPQHRKDHCRWKRRFKAGTELSAGFCVGEW